MRRGTLVWRIGAAIIGLELVFAVLLSWFVQTELRRFHLDRSEAELRQFAALIADRLGPDADLAPVDANQDLVRRLSETSGLRITLIARDGTVVAESESDPANMDDHSTRPEVASAISVGSGFSIRRSATLGYELMYFGLAVPDASNPTGTVRVSRPLTQIKAELHTVKRTIGIGFLVFIGATGIVVWFLSHRAGVAVSRIAAGARRFASGDLTHRISDTTSSELTDLTGALNDMAELLSKRIAQLRSQRAESQAVLESMTGGIIALGLDQRILSINSSAAQMLSVDPQQARGRLLQEVARQPALNQFVAETISAPSGQRDEFDLSADPPLRVSAISGPLRDAMGDLRGAVIALDDITQLRKLESMRSDFAANVSHELRTPITNIKGYIETLHETGFDDAEQANRFLAVISRNAERLGAIVSDMLVLTRLERQDQAEGIDARQSSVFSIAMNAIAHLSDEATHRRISVECTVDQRVRIPVNPALIEQALSNLLQNAIRYSPEGSAVRVSLEPANIAQPDDAVALCVEDHGSGIAREDLPRLFERFYRVDKARSREQGGTGLGLAIVKHIALAHGGRVDVQSEPGIGSVFKLVLPRDPR